MAVYKRTYRTYDGPLTPAWSRFLVLYRASRRTLFRSRFQTSFYSLCFFFPLLCLLGIYANAHLDVLTSFARRSGPLFAVDGAFFYMFLSIQCSLAFLLTAFVGPGLVSPDLANGALTLYLCRPFSRWEYIFGKMSVLLILLSGITWVPGLVLFFTQAAVGSGGWMFANWRLAGGIFWGSLLWLLVIGLLSLVLSAWVKWRMVAGALLLATLFLGAGFAHAINGVLGTSQGYLFDINSQIETVQHRLLGDGAPGVLPLGEAILALLVISAGCLWLLLRKIRPNEVVE